MFKIIKNFRNFILANQLQDKEFKKTVQIDEIIKLCNKDELKRIVNIIDSQTFNDIINLIIIDGMLDGLGDDYKKFPNRFYSLISEIKQKL